MENNELNNEQVNLLKRAYAHLKSSKVAKRIAALTIATAMALTIVSCDETSKNPNNPDLNAGTTQGSVSNENRNPIDVEGYSQILQNILLNEEYDNLIYRATTGQNHDLLKTGAFEPHPYAFLAGQGHNIEAIKNDRTDAYTLSFVLDEDPNSLYIYTRVLEEGSHWDCYLLKYELTEQEMDDYHLLHTGKNMSSYFIQSVFMNNEIAKTRDPEIIGKSKISASCFVALTENYQSFSSEFKDENGAEIILLNPDKGNLTSDIYIIPKFLKNNQMCFENEILHCNAISSTMDFKDDIFTGPTGYMHWIRFSSKNKHDVTFYLSQDANLNFRQCTSFEDTASKN